MRLPDYQISDDFKSQKRTPFRGIGCRLALSLLLNSPINPLQFNIPTRLSSLNHRFHLAPIDRQGLSDSKPKHGFGTEHVRDDLALPAMLELVAGREDVVFDVVECVVRARTLGSCFYDREHL
jgi:hypothetical protein